MKNLGSINGKVEIIVNPHTADEKPEQIALISSSNYIELTTLEAIDLADVITFAAVGADFDSLEDELPNFQRKKGDA